MKTLYVCYFALSEPLVQTQVLPYLNSLCKSGIEVYLLTFEPVRGNINSDKFVEQERENLRAKGIRWVSLVYHKHPSIPATLYDILTGARFAARLMREHKIEVLHARAHVPMAMALLVKRWTGCRLIFDLRGLMAEEYMDAGIWKENSFSFRAVKRVEQAGMRHADQVVVLTRRMREWVVNQRLKSREQITVIPCCVDFSRFDNEVEDIGFATNRFEVVYAGSVTGLYLLEEMARFFLHILARQPGAFLRILTASSPARTSAILLRAGLKPSDFWVGNVSPCDVLSSLKRARLGLSFRKASFAQIAASPTKIPEYLAAGLPVVSSAGVGDFDELFERERVGVVIRSLGPEGYAAAADQALSLITETDLSARCVAVARRYFDLVRVGGPKYVNVYRRIE